jgi:hypothetical protein
MLNNITLQVEILIKSLKNYIFSKYRVVFNSKLNDNFEGF